MKDLIIGILVGFLICLFSAVWGIDASMSRKIQAGALVHDGKVYRIIPLEKD